MVPADDTSVKALTKNPLGESGHVVAENVERLRVQQNLTFAALAKRLEDIDRPIPTLGLRKIVAKIRRVDADDLVALSLVFGVSPVTLLMPGMPGAADRSAKVAVTGISHPVYAEELWHWLKAQPGPPSWASVSGPLFKANALPAWEWEESPKDADYDD